MPKDLALERYLGRHIEPGLPQLSRPPQTWQHALVIPAYREAPALLDQLARHAPEKGLLSIVVLNQPRGQFDPQANAALQAACQRLPQHLTDLPAAFSLLRLNEAHDLLLCNMDYDGLGLIDWYLCYRHLVRAKVDGIRLCQDDVATAERDRLRQRIGRHIAQAGVVTAPRQPAPEFKPCSRVRRCSFHGGQGPLSRF